MKIRDSIEAIRPLAHRSTQGWSWDSEKSGDRIIEGLEQNLTEWLKNIPEELQAEYEAKYIAKFSKYLNANSRIMSTMITGCGNFPVRQQNKYREWSHNAFKNFYDWQAKVTARVSRISTKRLRGWAEIERLQIKLDSMEAMQDIMKRVNVIVRKKITNAEMVDEIVANGLLSEEQAIKLTDPSQTTYGGRGFYTFELANNNSKIKLIKIRLDKLKAEQNTETVEVSIEGVRVEDNAKDARLKLFFDGKPSDTMRSALKSNGFRWTPSQGCWQSYRNQKGYDLCNKKTKSTNKRITTLNLSMYRQSK